MPAKHIQGHGKGLSETKKFSCHLDHILSTSPNLGLASPWSLTECSYGAGVVYLQRPWVSAAVGQLPHPVHSNRSCKLRNGRRAGSLLVVVVVEWQSVWVGGGMALSCFSGPELSLSSDSDAVIAAALAPRLQQGREGDRGLVKELTEVGLVILQLAPHVPHPLVHLMLRETASRSGCWKTPWFCRCGNLDGS